MIDKGQIIAIMENTYIDYPGGSWHDHFVSKKKYLCVVRGETNNGNIWCKDSKGAGCWTSRDRVIAIIK